MHSFEFILLNEKSDQIQFIIKIFHLLNLLEHVLLVFAEFGSSYRRVFLDCFHKLDQYLSFEEIKHFLPLFSFNRHLRVRQRIEVADP
jgi:hypothetical protein